MKRMGFSNFKAVLKKTAARTVDDLWQAIAQGIETFSPNRMPKLFRRRRL